MASSYNIFSYCCGSNNHVEDVDDMEEIEPDSHIKDENLWHVSLTECSTGSVSVARVSAYAVTEDQSEVQSGPQGTFFGVYDGHGGFQASQFLKKTLYLMYQDSLSAPSPLSAAISTCEAEFTALVSASWRAHPYLASVGSCALLGAIPMPRVRKSQRRFELQVASLGDSRAVLGRLWRQSGASGGLVEGMEAVQLSIDHNANHEPIRKEVLARHPNEDDILVNKGGVWRLKGIIQVTRAIGDVYLKSQEFQEDPLLPKFQLSKPLTKPVLLAEPTVVVHLLDPNVDRFVVFATDGLWEHVSNEEAVNLVNKYPREGIAQRLVTVALMRSAEKRGVTYDEIKAIEGSQRREYHDDISAIVHFFDHDRMAAGSPKAPKLSLKSGEKYKGSQSMAAHSAVEMERTPIS